MKLTPAEKEHARALKIALRSENKPKKKLTLDERIAEFQERNKTVWKCRGCGYGASFGSSTAIIEPVQIPFTK